MDFIQLVIAKQQELQWTDLEIATKTGISEYIYYDLKHYKQYLTPLSYYSLCCVLGIPVSKNVSSVLTENNNIVGLPETSLQVAANSVDPIYLDKIERELSALKLTQTKYSTQQVLINNLRTEKVELEKQVQEKEKEYSEIVKSAYSSALRDSVPLISRGLLAEAEGKHLVEKEKYLSDIRDLVLSVDKHENRYLAIYTALYNMDRTLAETFPTPEKFIYAAVDIIPEFDLSIYNGVYDFYTTLGLDLETLSEQFEISIEDVTSILVSRGIELPVSENVVISSVVDSTTINVAVVKDKVVEKKAVKEKVVENKAGKEKVVEKKATKDKVVSGNSKDINKREVIIRMAKRGKSKNEIALKLETSEAYVTKVLYEANKNKKSK